MFKSYWGGFWYQNRNTFSNMNIFNSMMSVEDMVTRTAGGQGCDSPGDYLRCRIFTETSTTTPEFRKPMYFERYVFHVFQIFRFGTEKHGTLLVISGFYDPINGKNDNNKVSTTHEAIAACQASVNPLPMPPPQTSTLQAAMPGKLKSPNFSSKFQQYLR